MGTSDKIMDQTDCRHVKEGHTDPMLFGFPDNLAAIRIQSEDDILLLFAGHLDHGCAPLKDKWDCDICHGCARRHRNVVANIVISNRGQGRQ